jgi:hypothetical protein
MRPSKPSDLFFHPHVSEQKTESEQHRPGSLALASLVALTSSRFAEACLRHPFFVLLRDPRAIDRYARRLLAPHALRPGAGNAYRHIARRQRKPVRH